MNNYYVYILASGKNGTLYIGVTSDLKRRIYQHKNKLIEGFTEKYKVSQLVYFDQTKDVESAILREKQLKKWSRKKKIMLTTKVNPKFEEIVLV